MTSPDGITWTIQHLSCELWHGSLYAMVMVCMSLSWQCGDDNVMTSPDGINLDVTYHVYEQLLGCESRMATVYS